MRLLFLCLFAAAANACLDGTPIAPPPPVVVTPKVEVGSPCALPASVVNDGTAEFDQRVRITVPRFMGVTHDFANVEFRGHDGELLSSWAGPQKAGSAQFIVQIPRVTQGKSYFIVDACDREAARGRRPGVFEGPVTLEASLQH